MPWIREEGRALHVSVDEAASLTSAGLLYACSDCSAYHHEEFERWDEIASFLRTAHEFHTFMAAVQTDATVRH